MQLIQPITTYNQAINYIFSLTSQEGKPYTPGIHLERIQKFLKRVGNPQNSYPTIHITGTAGKGSVSYLSAKILAEAGLKVGLHTSPHLVKLNEKFQIIKHVACNMQHKTGNETTNLPLCPNKQLRSRNLATYQPISCTDQELIDLTNWYIDNNKVVHRLKEQPLTFYEAIIAMVFKYFELQKVDVAVIEVGMGGRLDATNVINSDVAVLNSVGLDHTEFLGNTLEEITWDKMHIMKPEKVFISGLRDAKLNQIVQKHAKDLNTKLLTIGKDFDYEITKSNLNGVQFKYQNTYHLNLIGDYQAHNASIAITTATEYIKSQTLNPKSQINSKFKIQNSAIFLISGKYACASQSYFPQLKQELEADNYKVEIIDHINPSAPNLEENLKHFQTYDFQDSIVVTHSLGGSTFLQYISDNHINIQKLILISPPTTDLKSSNSNWYENSGYKNFALDLNFEIIKERVGGIVLIYSDDELISQESFLDLAQKLDAKLIFEPNKKHFFAKDYTHKPSALLDQISDSTFHIPHSIIHNAFETANIPARFDIIQKDPMIILDGAHNELKIQSFVSSVKKYFINRPIELLFSAKHTKDINPMIKTLCTLKLAKIYLTEFTKQYYTQINSYKLEDMEIIFQKYTDNKIPIIKNKNPQTAFQDFRTNIKSKSIGIATGSLYLLGKIYEIL